MSSCSRSCSLLFPLFLLVFSSLTLAVPADRYTLEEPAPIRVLNHESGETIRYPVPLLIGTLGPGTTNTIRVVNTSSDRETAELEGLTFRGQFKALTELVPGENKLRIQSGDAQIPFEIHYKPQTNPYYVRAIYLTDSSGETTYQAPYEDDPQNFREKFSTALKLMQTFTAERMYDQGFGRKTFNLEYNDSGDVKIHVLKEDHPAEHYYQMGGVEWWRTVLREIGEKMPDDKAKNVVVAAYTRYRPQEKKTYGHTALGGAALGLVGSGVFYTWPDGLDEVYDVFLDAGKVDTNKVMEDSAFRKTIWATASTSIGAALHETGHAFDLPHCKDQFAVMTRGFDHFNRFFTFYEPPSAAHEEAYVFEADEMARFSPISAAYLTNSRWFAVDKPANSSGAKPVLADKIAEEEIVLSAPDGLSYVRHRNHEGEVVDYATFKESQTAPQTLRYSKKQLASALGDGGRYTTEVLDANGDKGSLKWYIPLGFIRKWRFCPTTRPWEDHSQFLQLEEKEIQQIIQKARRAKLVESPHEYVSFLDQYPPEEHKNRAGYALRSIYVPWPCNLKILAGSDDAMRIWVNGEKVLEKLEFHGAKRDQYSASVHLLPGRTDLLVEVSQVDIGWRFYLRIEEESGRMLKLTDKGELVAVR